MGVEYIGQPFSVPSVKIQTLSFDYAKMPVPQRDDPVWLIEVRSQGGVKFPPRVCVLQKAQGGPYKFTDWGGNTPTAMMAAVHHRDWRLFELMDDSRQSFLKMAELDPERDSDD